MVQGGIHTVEWVTHGPGVAKEEDQAKSRAVVKGGDKAQHVIVAKMVDEAESVFVAYKDDGAQHMIVVIVAKQGDKDVCAAVAHIRMRPGT